MVSSVVTAPFGDELVLHLEVTRGKTADAEVVGQALSAWVAAAKAAAEVLDPYSQLRVGLVTVEPGSVRLRAVFDFIETHIVSPPADFLSPYPRIKQLANKLVVATVIGIPTGLAIVVGEHVLYPDPPPNTPLEVHEEYRAGRQKLIEAAPVQKRVRKFYETVEKDPNLIGVSVRDGGTMRPLMDVPRDEFADRSGLWSLQLPDVPTRPQAGIWDVIVTHPALFSKPKPWKFLRDGLPFSAVMMDEKFLQAIASGALPIRIQEGVVMRVQVEWTERQDGQTWEPVNRTRRITRVISPLPSEAAAPLLDYP